MGRLAPGAWRRCGRIVGHRRLARALFLCALASGRSVPQGLGPLLGSGEKPPSWDPAAGPSSPSAGSAAAPARPGSIPMAIVARSAEQALDRLQAIEESLAAGAGERAIVADLPRREDEVRRMEGLLEGVAPESLLPRVVEDARQRWSRMDLDVRELESRLESSAKILQEQQDEVRNLAELWSATYADALARGAPDVVTARIAGIRARAKETDARFKERFDAILVLQDRVARLLASVGRGKAAAERAAFAVQQSLFMIESAPLWAAFRFPGSSASVARDFQDTWRTSLADFRYFLRHEQERFLVHLAVFCALAALIAAIRRRGREWLATSDPSTTTAEIILSRPFSAAALISLLLGYWMYVAPTITMLRVAAVLVLVPFLRILPGLAPKSLLPPLYGLGVLWAIERFRDLVIAHSLLQRLVLLVASILALAGLLVALRPGGPARTIEAGRWWKAALTLAHVAVLFLAISIVCNLAGNVTMAGVLTEGTLLSAFTAVLLFAVFKIVEAIVAVPLRSPAVRGLRALRERADVVQGHCHAAVRWTCLAAWIYLTLDAFRVWDRVVAAGSAVLARRWVLGKIDISLGNVAVFGVALVLALVVSKILRVLLDDVVLPDLGLPRGVPAAIARTVQYVIVGAGVFMAFMAGGLDMSSFGFLAGALGVGIGFGLQNIVNNFVSGVILIYERPIQEGDVIEAGKVMGRVRRIGIRSSTVWTFEGAEVVLPNASLISAEVVNWTLSDRVCRAELKVGVAYGTDPRRVVEILREVVGRHADVLGDPAPAVLFTGLGESSLDFSIRFWTPDYDSMLVVKSAVLSEVYAALRESGIEIPFPQRDLHLRSVGPEAVKSLSGTAPGPVTAKVRE